MISPRLLVVIHSDVEVVLTLTGALPGNPALAVVGPLFTTTVAPKDGAWVAKLTPGTFLLRLDADTEALAVPLTLAASAPVTFTTYRYLGEHPTPPYPKPAVKTTRSWVATSLQATGDKKDPWPPPGTPFTDEPWSAWIVRSVDGAAPRGL